MLSLLLAVTVSIGSQTIENVPRVDRGSSWITFHHNGALDLQWELEVDGQLRPLEPGAHVRCKVTDQNRPDTPIECTMDVPVFQDNAVLRVRPAGTEDWSNAWDDRAIPCGWFVGEPVFRNIEWSVGQVGEACNYDYVPPPDGEPIIVEPGTGPRAPTNVRVQ